MLNVGLYQEMQGRVPDPSYLEYRVQPGVIDLDHLELVSLKRVAMGLWMPYFRLIASPPVQNGVYIPQRRSANESRRDVPNNQNLVLFAREDGSYIPVVSALQADYAGLLDRDLPVLDGTSAKIAVRFEVNKPYCFRRHIGAH